MRAADELRRAAVGALAALTGEDEGDGGAAPLLADGQSSIAAPAGVDAQLDELGERIAAVGVEVADIASELRSYLASMEGDPARLHAVEERLDAIDRLTRKHGGSVESVLAHAEHCREQIQRLECAEERSSELDARLREAEERRARLATELTRARRTGAPELSARVTSELDALAMEDATIEVALEPHPDGFGAAGAEGVELRVATNPGMPVSPLRDAASGGELSRVMLALRGAGGRGGVPTVVFDEIDAGIGGNTARAVGERLRRLGSERQVICITHLPQVATLASAHFRIEKRVEAGETRAFADRLAGDDLVGEICRMLGADRADETASRHARELLAAA